MCTCITYKSNDAYFGRNLDLESRFGEKAVITPRNYLFRLKNEEELRIKYGMVGMASVAGDYPLYAEAANEAGLSLAGLYFPGNARCFPPEPDKLNLAQFELIPYFLGKYSKIKELRRDLEQLNIINTPFADGFPTTDMHWMMSDGEECVVLEQTADGLHVYDNPVGVLTNNPPFPYHLMNLRNYRSLSPSVRESTFSDKLPLESYGNGMGAIGLPGDCSPMSRFVRTAYLKFNSPEYVSEEESVTQFFHILDGAAMVEGSVVTDSGKPDKTNYSCCINTTHGIFYYKTYSNNRITAVKMTEENKTSQTLTIFDLLEEQDINYLN